MMNFEVNDVVIYNYKGLIGYGIVEEIDNTKQFGNVKIKSLDGRVSNWLWGLDVEKLDELTYDSRRNELVEQFNELEAAFKLTKENKMQVLTREQLTFDWLMNEGNYKDKNILIVGSPKSGKSRLAKLLERNNNMIYDDTVQLFTDLVSWVTKLNKRDYKSVLVLTTNKSDDFETALDSLSELLQDWLVINLG